LEGLALAGVLWYQGEGNAHNATLHEQLFPLLQKSWRTHFAAPELPFYFVQLSGISTLPTWGHFRDSQRRLGVLPRTYMTVSHDLGEAKNIHPKRKREIAERLVAAALVHEYGQTGVPCGPVYLGAQLKSNKILLHFQYGKGMHTSDGKAPKGFEVAGKNGAFVPAKARIVGETIEVWSDAVAQPQQVRYAWDSFPQTNVVGSNGFPISTFSDRVF
jgi:sialate O-acetylesterase